jgi:hypothetical protein
VVVITRNPVHQSGIYMISLPLFNKQFTMSEGCEGVSDVKASESVRCILATDPLVCRMIVGQLQRTTEKNKHIVIKYFQHANMLITLYTIRLPVIFRPPSFCIG